MLHLRNHIECVVIVRQNNGACYWLVTPTIPNHKISFGYAVGRSSFSSDVVVFNCSGVW